MCFDGKALELVQPITAFDTDEKKMEAKGIGQTFKTAKFRSVQRKKNELLSHLPLYTTFQWLKKTWLIIRAVGLHFKCEPSSLQNVLYGVLFFSSGKKCVCLNN